MGKGDPDLERLREGVPVGTPALDLEPPPRSRAVARSSHGKMEAPLVALVGSTGDPRGCCRCLLQGTASHVSIPSSDIRVAGCVPRQSPLCWERSTRAPQVLCGPAGTLWQSLARAGTGATLQQGCCYIVKACQSCDPIPRATHSVPGFNLRTRVPHAREIGPGPSQTAGTMLILDSPAASFVSPFVIIHIHIFSLP